MKPYSPEWAAGDLRRAGRRPSAASRANTSTHACVGQTIEIDGQRLPYRPVAVSLGKTVNNGWGGYECCWARTLLAALVGALEVPGGILGTTVRLNRPMSERHESVQGRSRRLHGLPAQSDRQRETWSARAQHPQRLPHAWCRSRPTAPGARRSGRRISRGCSSTARRRACRSVTLPERVVRLPHQPGDLVLGHRRDRRDAWRAFRSSWPSPTRATRPTTSPTCCCPTRPTSRACSSSASAARSTSSSSGTTRASRCASRRSRRAAKRATSPTSPPSSPGAPGCSTPYNAAINRGAAGVPLKACKRLFARYPRRSQRRRDLGRGLQSGERGAHRRRAKRTASTGGRSTASRPSRSRRATGTSSRRWSSKACASSCPTRSAWRASARSSAGACTSTACTGGTSSSRNTRRCRRGRISPAPWQARSPPSAAASATTIRSGCSPRAACSTRGAATSACR